MGNPWGRVVGVLLSMCTVAGASAQTLTLQRLDAEATTAEVVAGTRPLPWQDNRNGDVIFEGSHHPRWWKLTATRSFPASQQPRLLLESPYLTRVQAWVPGSTSPSRHALYGADADDRYSTRALVIDLPSGLEAGDSVLLRVEAPAAIPMRASLVPLAQVHRGDLLFVGWRSFILGSLSVLPLLALTLWLRLRDPQYLYFAASVLLVTLYLLALGGEMRAIPWLAGIAGSGVGFARVTAGLATVCMILFQRRYLQLPQFMPRVSRWLAGCVAAILAISVFNVFSEASLGSLAGNVCLLISGMLLVGSGVVMAWRGQRQAWALLFSWLPFLLLAMLRTAELAGWLLGPPWLGHGITISVALSALLLSIGMADTMLQLRRDRDHASRRANVDSLTGMSTRLAVDEYLAKAIQDAAANATPLSIAFIDVDHFKAVNDRHGHAIGDECLRILAARVRRQLRASDMLGRYGGDEMLAVMPGMDLEQARVRAEAMRNTVDVRPIDINHLSLDVSLSIGVAQWQPGELLEQLLQRADMALYAGKAAGRNRTCLAAASQTFSPCETMQ
ncbi:GGDEF domain-containing protein [Pseudoxanthomonas dokdonensis]|uniref:diguanylate cyclase n=1 Tax=Pseudoxanthomonas dokdonensis TaxID=344882 RepID=A0A0R0CLL0_9GAMM|nr:diguanylate cyclase [Pseudoxanthomonas dokdonensis]KRG70921.1 hypothetical protein ABB29_03565 [Pseudoxanthomonas dokdonensis]